MKRLTVPVIIFSLFSPLYAGAEPRGSPLPDVIKEGIVRRIVDSYVPRKVFPAYIDANGDGENDRFQYDLRENIETYPHTRYSINYQEGIGNSNFSNPRPLYNGIGKGGAVMIDMNDDNIPDLAAIEENSNKLLLTLMPGWIDNSGKYTIRSEEAVYIEAKR